MSRVFILATASVLVGAAGAIVFLVLSPFSRTTLTLETTSDAAGYSQLFVAGKDEVFTERRSAGAPVIKGTNRLTYLVSGLRGGLVDQFRWDPLEEPGSVELTAARFDTGLLGKRNIEVLVRPILDVALERTASGIQVTTLSNDGQVLLVTEALPPQGALAMAVGKVSLITGVLTGLVVLLVGSAYHWWHRSGSHARRMPLRSWLLSVTAIGVGVVLVSSALGFASNLLWAA